MKCIKMSKRKWLNVNKPSLNLSKTNYIIFHSTTTKIPTDITIKIGNKHLRRANDVKILGLFVDEIFSLKYHPSEFSKKLD